MKEFTQKYERIHPLISFLKSAYQPLNIVHSCTFRNVEETLQAGYCQGGNCNIEGQQHPDMHAYITI